MSMLIATLVWIHLFTTHLYQSVWDVQVFHIANIAWLHSKFVLLIIVSILVATLILLLKLIPISLHHFLRFNLKASLFTFLISCFWDLFKCKEQLWNVSLEYTLNVIVFKLPIEHYLVNLIVPLVFVAYMELAIFKNKKKMTAFVQTSVTWFHILVLILILVLNYEYTYTFIVCLVSCAYLLFHFIYENARVRNQYWTHALPFLIVYMLFGEIVTGLVETTPIFVYNQNEIMSFRILSLPSEEMYWFLFITLSQYTLYAKAKKALFKESRSNKSEQDQHSGRNSLRVHEDERSNN